ncbi:hypothetical protein BSZ36_14765 [Rubricoccus marinus]|uniref:Uncharacterized protein n=1 Tax=Rubricoccus marinus TaxID=716817 RepID=A0A259U256_9BACT|nr:hypothetical protein BSZ36_14765 [Rubricoccus marinus]
MGFGDELLPVWPNARGQRTPLGAVQALATQRQVAGPIGTVRAGTPLCASTKPLAPDRDLAAECRFEREVFRTESISSNPEAQTWEQI